MNMGNSSSSKLLCLDGGGVRGVIESRILEYIEDKTKRKIKDSFEWIAGTSTGGLVALYLGLDHTASECMDLYKTMKNEIFGAEAYIEIDECTKGVRDVDAYERAVNDNCDNLKRVFKKFFGEKTRMSDIKNVKVIITVTNGKQDPLELIHYTNFDEKTRDTLVWQVARATAAAPGYFPKFMIDKNGPLFDGGLTANNPTLTALSLIVNYNKENEIRNNLNMCLSLGTGVMPIVETELPDLPTGAFDAFWKWKSGELNTLVLMFTNELTRTDGYVIDQAKAFCSIGNIKYYRLNPTISQNINLAETDDKKFDQLISETDTYLEKFNDLIEEIIQNLIN